jgi:hypothetical protein
MSTEPNPITQEQSGDQAPEQVEVAEETQAQPAGESTTVEDQPDESTDDQLLTPDEVSRLKGKELDLYRKAQKAFTQKSQKLAEQRRELEPYQEFIKSYQEDPRKTIQWLAEQHGINFRESDSRAETAAKVEAATKTLTDELRAALGEDFDFIGAKIGPTLERSIKSIVDESIKPIAQLTNQINLEAAQKKTEAVLQSFDQKHPGWRKHEKAMIDLASKITVKNMDEADFMEMVYGHVTRDLAIAKEARSIVNKINASAAKSESPEGGVEQSRIAPTLQGKSFKDKFQSAWNLAKQGVTLER